MNKNDTVKEIIFIPKNLYESGNISIYSLLEKSGYFESRNQISEVDIYNELVGHPNCVHQWLRWSDDKRTNSGWYFKQNESGKYIVGYFSPDTNLKRVEYDDIARACAVFIKMEIDSVGPKSEYIKRK
jgi:hypothetical protein